MAASLTDRSHVGFADGSEDAAVAAHAPFLFAGPPGRRRRRRRSARRRLVLIALAALLVGGGLVSYGARPMGGPASADAPVR